MPVSSWLGVSLAVDGELAEAVSEVMARFAPNGVSVESGVSFHNGEDEGKPSGPVRVSAYLPVNEQLEDTRRRLEEALWYLGRIQPLPDPVFTLLEEIDWLEAWKKNYQPVPLGKRLIIVPSWMAVTDPDRIAIKIDPGMAFGTGTHPSTQLCLELLEQMFDQKSVGEGRGSESPMAVIDIGCGSGILSIAAIKLGARHALGVDLDEAAVRSARENAIANDVAGKLTLGVGSVAEVRQGQFGIQKSPLVLVNILATVIIDLFTSGLADLVEPGGTLILSGVLQEQANAVLSAARAQRMGLVEKRQMGDWIGLVLT